jgi:ABC-type transporter Mla MlaB component
MSVIGRLEEWDTAKGVTVRFGFGPREQEQRTIVVRGELSKSTSRRVLSKMHGMASRGRGPITVDVSGLSYFDSVSVTMLLGTERIIERQLGCPVDIRGLDEATSRLTGLAVEPAPSR